MYRQNIFTVLLYIEIIDYYRIRVTFNWNTFKYLFYVDNINNIVGFVKLFLLIFYFGSVYFLFLVILISYVFFLIIKKISLLFFFALF